MTDTQQEAVYDVIIIGAGIAGLCAAHLILKEKSKLSLLVMEAKDREGGRTLTKKLSCTKGGSYTWDLGGQWVGTNQTNITELLKELDIETYPQFTTGRKVCEIGTKITTYDGDLPSIGALGLLDLNRFLKKIDSMSMRAASIGPTPSKDVEKLDAMSFKALLDKRTHFANVKSLAEATFSSLCGVDSSKISALYALLLVNSAKSIINLVEDKEFGGQGLKIKGGTQQLIAKLKDMIGSDKVKLSSPVVEIDQSDKSHILVITQSGSKLKAKAVVCCIPPNQLNKVKFNPNLPVNKQQFFQSSPMGNYIKYVITYETAFWREGGYSGMVISADASPTSSKCSVAPITICYDATSPDDKYPALVVISAGKQAFELDSLSREERQKSIVDHLSRLFNSGKARTVIEFAEKNWRLEPFSGGCPCTIPPCGYASQIGPELREPLDRVHFAGTEFATEWIGYMEGAVQSAKRVATELAEKL